MDEKSSEIVNKGYSFVIPIEPMPAPRARSSKNGGYFNDDYSIWRKRIELWLTEYLSQTNFEMIFYLSGSQEGYKTVRDIKSGQPRDENGRLRGKLRSDFQGWELGLTFVLKRPEGEIRSYPTNKSDLDNMVKGAVDSLFEHPAFKQTGLNDSFIQITKAMKRYTILDSDEVPHIEVTMRYL